MPVFNSISASATPVVKPAPARVSNSSVKPAPHTENIIPSQQVASAKEPQIRPVSSITDSELRKRRLHGENISTPSISGMMNGANHLFVSEPGTNIPKAKETVKAEPFDAGQLIISWKDFADTVDAGQLKSALSVREPVLLGNYCVAYNLDNEVQRQRILLDLKSKLLAHLHNSLNNELISIEFNVTENLEEIMNKPYTDQEKFNSLAAKYPALGLMKNRFGLDFEWNS